MGTLRLRYGSDCGILAPDGKTWAVPGSERVFLFSVPDGKERRRLRIPRYSNYAIAFSPDGRILATGGEGDAAYLLDAATGRLLQRLGGHKDLVPDLAFSPDAPLVATVDYHGSAIRVWETTTGRLVRTISTGEAAPECVAWGPGGKVFATGLCQRVLWVAEPSRGAELKSLEAPGGRVDGVAASADGRNVLTGGNRARLWDIAGNRPPVELRGTEGRVTAVACSPDGNYLATADSGSSIRLWDHQGRQVRQLRGFSSRVSSLSFSADGSVLASCGLECGPRLWDVAKGREIVPGAGHHAPVRAVVWLPHGRALASTGEDGTVYLWDATTARALSHWQAGMLPGELSVGMGANSVHRLDAAPDGSRLLTEGSAARVSLWETATGRRTHLVTTASGAGFSPNGHLVACRRWSGPGERGRAEVLLYDADTGREVRALRGHGRGPGCLAYSPDGTTIATGDYDVPYTDPRDPDTAAVLTLWDLASGRPRLELHGPGWWMLAFSSDGRTLAAIDRKRDTGLGTEVILRETATGQERGRLRSGPRLLAAAFSPDGRVLATVGDGGVRLWELPARREYARLEGHQGWVWTAAFSPDGRHLATGSADTTVLVWDVPPLPAAREIPATALPALWEALAGDAAAAYRAMADWGAAGPRAVRFLSGRLRPVPVPDSSRLKRLLADLDNDEFVVRQRAALELEKVGDGAEPMLRKALEGRLSPESRRRAQALTDRLAPEWLRTLRAVEVLERLGSPEAQALLKDLATGWPPARLTREAQASLHRLVRRQSAP
jgi:WD40 repeat protein